MSCIVCFIIAAKTVWIWCGFERNSNTFEVRQHSRNLSFLGIPRSAGPQLTRNCALFICGHARYGSQQRRARHPTRGQVKPRQPCERPSERTGQTTGDDWLMLLQKNEEATENALAGTGKPILECLIGSSSQARPDRAAAQREQALQRLTAYTRSRGATLRRLCQCPGLSARFEATPCVWCESYPACF